MPILDRSQSLAVLIDADNTSERYAHAIFEEVAKLGEANVRRIYGDFSGARLADGTRKFSRLQSCNISNATTQPAKTLPTSRL